MKISNEDKQRIGAIMFFLDLEVNRGTWSEDECIDKLLEFCKNCETKQEEAT